MDARPLQLMAPVLTASLPVVSYKKLLSSDPETITALKRAGEEYGFYYLDLSEGGEEQLLKNWRHLLRLTKRYFDQPLDIKMRDNRSSDTHGYEPVRTSAGALPNSKDLYETLKVSRSEIHERSKSIPQMIQAELDFFASFVSDLDTITMNVLRCFSKAMDLEGSFRYENCHRPEAASRTTFSMFRYPKQASLAEGIGHNKHTDLGTLTLLLSEQWGLQVLSPGINQWEFVEPRSGMAIMNVGDSLRFLSGNKLKSSVHRVVPLQELQLEDRYSLAYFLRPEDDVRYTTVDGQTVTARAWHDRKFNVFRESHTEQSKDSILTGGMEKADLIVA